MNTGERMRIARKRMRLTQKDIAGNEFHRSLISQIETGLIEPSTNTLETLADRLGVPPAFFMETPGEEKRTEQAIRESETLLKQKKYNEAFSLILDAIPTISSLRLKGRLLTYAGGFLSQWNKNKEALVLLEVAQRYFRFDENALGLIECLFQSGKVYSQINQPKLAIENFNTAIDLVKWLADEPGSDRPYFDGRLIQLYLNAGKELVTLGEFEKSIMHLKEAVDLAINNDLHIDLGLVQQQMGNTYLAAGDYKEALQHFRAAYRCFDQKEHGFYRAQCLLGLGKAFAAQKDFSKAITQYLEALNEDKGISALASIINFELAQIYKEQHDWDRAIHWGVQAVEHLLDQQILGALYTENVVKNIFSLVGNLYKGSNDLSQAKAVLNKGISWCQNHSLINAALDLTTQLCTLRNS
jgi:tetratricopeptide (TPR) repeat protein